MNPLDEIRQLINATRAQNAELQRQEQELRDHQERQPQEERKEPTLLFADIKEISSKEMTDTEKAFQIDVWMIIQHKREWLNKVKANNIQHPKDIQVDKAVIKAKFRDDKIMKKVLEQIAEVHTSPYFKQVGPLAMVLDMYMKKGYYNADLEAYVQMGEVTNENIEAMIGHAKEKARREADAEIKLLTEMESQETQDMWWQMYLSTLPGRDEHTKPFIITKMNTLIRKWEQHLKNEIKAIGLRQQLRIIGAVIQLIK